MTKYLLIDPKRCVSCRSCELACSFHHEGVFNPRLSRVNVFEFKDTVTAIPVMCLQCDLAPCVATCPTGALRRDEEGIVVHDEEKCIVCKTCVSSCPLGNITYSALAHKVLKCDLCGGDPQCALVCPTGAITLADSAEVLDKRKIAAARARAAFTEV